MEHYYSKVQTSRLKPIEIEATLRGLNLRFISGSGVFSKHHIDPGSILLIEKCILEPTWSVLDLGCGYGPVGIAIAKSIPTLKVIMTDVNERAVKLSKRNVKLNNLKNVHVVCGDAYEAIEETFDTILLNPPQTAGKDLCLLMIREAKNYLKPGGLLQIVARHNRGGKTLALYMDEIFGNVDKLAIKSGFRIYFSKNNSDFKEE